MKIFSFNNLVLFGMFILALLTFMKRKITHLQVGRLVGYFSTYILEVAHPSLYRRRSRHRLFCYYHHTMDHLDAQGSTAKPQYSLCFFRILYIPECMRSTSIFTLSIRMAFNGLAPLLVNLDQSAKDFRYTRCSNW